MTTPATPNVSVGSTEDTSDGGLFVNTSSTNLATEAPESSGTATPAAPDIFTGSTDNSADGGLFTDVNVSGLADDNKIVEIIAGTGLAGTSLTGPQATLTIDSTVVTLIGTQTLTNKTLTSPVITGGIISTGDSVLTGNLTLQGVNSGAGASPFINLFRVDAVPLVGDFLGSLQFTGTDSAGNFPAYASVFGRVISPTDGNESGSIEFRMQHNGSFTQSYAFQSDRLLLLNDNDIQFFQHNGTSFDVTLQAATPSADRIITLPNATGTLSITTASETLTNKTLTSPVINTSISGSAFLDEDNMVSNSATKVASQQSIKAYVDAQVATVPVGDITSVVAGTGLSGGGTSGDVTLNLDVTTLGTVEANKAVTANANGDVKFPDNERIIFGNGNDLIIRHESSSDTSYIESDDNLLIKGDDVFIQNQAGNTNIAKFVDGGGVSLYHNSNTPRFVTTTSGTSTTGIHSASTGFQSSQYFWSTADNVTALFAGANFEIALAHIHNTGFKLTNSGTGSPAVELQFVDSNEAIGSDGTNLILTSGGTAFKIPTSDGSSGQALVTDSNGVLSFSSIPQGDVTLNGTQTLTNKTLTSPILNTSISGSAFLDEDDMASNSATKVASQQSIKAYVDSNVVTSIAADNITTGDAAVTIATSSGNITIDAQGSNTDILLKGTTGGVDKTFLLLDGSSSGFATFSSGLSTSGTLRTTFGNVQVNSDGAKVEFGASKEIDLTHVHNTGLLLTNAGTGTPAVELQFVDSNEAISSDGTNLILTSGGTEFKVPTSDGSSGQFIKTDGNGVLSFDTVTVSSAADDITIGDSAVTIATTSGNITIDAQGADTDIIFKGTDNTNDITALTLDMSEAGKAVFNDKIEVPKIRLTSTTNASGSSTNHPFEIVAANGTGQSLRIDRNQISAYNSGSASNLFLNPDGGIIVIGSGGMVLGTDDTGINFGANSEIDLQHIHDIGLRITNSQANATLQFVDANESVSSDGTNLILTSGGTAFKMPTSDGSSGQALVTDASGNLSFASTGGGGDVTLNGVQTLTNKTLTSPKINENVVVTSTATEINILDGVTATTAELNYNDITTLGTVEANKTVTADSLGNVKFLNDDKIQLGEGTAGSVDLRHQALTSTAGISFITSDSNLRLEGETVSISNASGFGNISTSTDGVFVGGPLKSSGTLELMGGGLPHKIHLKSFLSGSSIYDDITYFEIIMMPTLGGTTGAVEIKSVQTDLPMNFSGNDGGTTINALQLDFANNGKAIFRNEIALHGSTIDSNLTTITCVDPTASRTITLPDETGTVSLRNQLKGNATNGAGVFSDELIARKLHIGTILSAQDDSSQGLIAGRPMGGFFSQISLSSNGIYFMPIMIPGTGAAGNFTVGGFRFRTGFSGTTLANGVKMGLYTLNKFGYPSQLVSKSSRNSTSQNNVDLITTPDVTSITPGRYAMAIAATGGGTVVVANFNSSSAGGSFYQEGFCDLMTSAKPTGLFKSNGLSSGELPTDLSSTSGYSDQSTVPFMMITYGSTYTGE